MTHGLLLRMTNNNTFLLIRIINTGRSSEEEISSKRLCQIDYASRDRLKRLAILKHHGIVQYCLYSLRLNHILFTLALLFRVLQTLYERPSVSSRLIGQLTYLPKNGYYSQFVFFVHIHIIVIIRVISWNDHNSQ